MREEIREKMSEPVDNYQSAARGWRFGEKLWRRGFLPAVHLGEDILAAEGEDIKAVLAGEVVFSRTLAGREDQRSWGGLVVLRHRDFYSVYGHLTDLRVAARENVLAGAVLGKIAGGNTAENGWWEKPHLHWGIYTGPWRGEVLPGWWKIERWWRTRLSWWQNPAELFSE